MVELWVINDTFCSFRLADGTREKKSSSLAYQNTVTFLLPQENFQSQPSGGTDTKFNNCKALQCLTKTHV